MSDRMAVLSQFGMGGGGSSAASPTDARSIRRQERSDRQMARSYNKAEIDLMKQYGASKEEIAAEKARNIEDFQKVRSGQKADGYQEWEGGLLATAGTYGEKDYASKIGDVISKTAGLYDQYGFDPTLTSKVSGGKVTTGFQPRNMAYHVANPGTDGYNTTGRFGNMGKMLNIAKDTYGKELTAEELAPYGNLKEMKKSPGTYKLKVYGDKTANGKAYFTKTADGKYSATDYTRYRFDADKKGGFFSSTLGQIAMIGASIWLGPQLAAAWGTGSVATVGSSIAAGATMGGVNAALSGGDIGKGILTGGIGGGIGAGLGGADISQGFGATVNPANAWSPFGADAPSWANSAARGAVSGAASTALRGGNPIVGAAGGAAGGGVSGAIGGATGQVAGSIANNVVSGELNEAMADGTTQPTSTKQQQSGWSSMYGGQQNDRQRIAAQYLGG